jgi:predicted nucleotidyltransferase
LLFGSRVDDQSCGGDIDLYVESQRTPAELLARELHLYSRLQAELGDQKIDLVVRSRGRSESAVGKEARREATLGVFRSASTQVTGSLPFPP